MENKLIDDDRLTPELCRTRSGPHQEFRIKGNRTFDADFILEPPERHFYAELIEGKWYWMNGCAECNGNKAQYAYIKCKKHDVCQGCGIDRASLTETPWGSSRGFICVPCANKRHEEEKARALLKMENKEYNKYDYCGTRSIICPYCDLAYGQDEDEVHSFHDEDTTIICDRCDNTYTVEMEFSISYTTSKVRQKKKRKPPSQG